MNFDIAFYWKLFWRRLPIMMLFVVLCGGLSLITAMRTPETWSTSARLLVEAPQIPDDMVASTVQTDAIEQLDIIQQKLLTRANLIDIANQFQVFENIREMEPDTVVTKMENATIIRRTAGRNQATLMTIEFEGRSSRTVADVVNRYVTLVLEENAEFRVSRAENTLAFFEQEVERLGQDLDVQSSRIAAFKSANVSALPEDQSYRLNRQNLLQERLAQLERDAAAAEAQRREILRIYEATGSVQPQRNAMQQTLEEAQLLTARAELAQFLSLYSERHPRVIRLKDRVTRLEAIVEEQVRARTEMTAVTESGEEALSPERALLQTTLAEIDSRLEFQKNDLESTRQELIELQDAITLSSANGIQLAALERDYENIQARYNAAVNNLNSARMSERIESTAQGQRITVIENATAPSVPSGPNRMRMIAMGLMVGFGLAGAYFMLLELLNRTVRRPAELVSRFDVTPLTTIPYLESRTERMVRRGGLLAATAVVMIGVPLALWYVDTNYLPLEIVVQKGLARLGLG